MTTTLKPAKTGTEAIWQRISPSLIAAGVPTYSQFAPNPVEGTGDVFVVVQPGSPSGTRSKFHVSLQRPVVGINTYADVTRDPDGLVTKWDAESKALAIHEFLTPLLAGQVLARCDLLHATR